MPEIAVESVLSVSSADPRHRAENLLHPDGGGRWRSGGAGEKRISVVLQLPRPHRIHSVHIGNDGAAFVELLVALGGGDFQVLLPTAAFLSPSESRRGVSLQRVRMFGPTALLGGAQGGQWDRVRIVCTQPYCATRPFGLSFVRLFSPPQDGDEETPKQRWGPFTLRGDSGSEAPLRPGELFYRRPPSDTAPPLPPPGPSYAAAALQAPKPSAPPKRRPAAPQKNPTKTPKEPRGGEEPIKGMGDPIKGGGDPIKGGNDPIKGGGDPIKGGGDPIKGGNDPIKGMGDPIKKGGGDPIKKGGGDPIRGVGDPIKGGAEPIKGGGDPIRGGREPLKRGGDPIKGMGGPIKKEGGDPIRGGGDPMKGGRDPVKKGGDPSVRGAGDPIRKGGDPIKGTGEPIKGGGDPIKGGGDPIKGGADPIRGGGDPIKEGGVLVGLVVALSGFTHPLRGRLRAAAVAMGAKYRPQWGPDCTHLVCAFPRTPKAAAARSMGGVVVTPAWIWDCQRLRQRLPCDPYLLDGSASSGSDGEEEPAEAPPTQRPAHRGDASAAKPRPPTPPSSNGDTPEGDAEDSAGDTEDELRRVTSVPPDDPYGGSTEENTDSDDDPIPPLPDFFEDKTFFLYGDFEAPERRRLQRFVIAFGGSVAPYMSEAVTHVVTAQEWDDTFEEALELNPALQFVRPRWVLLCAERLRPLPPQPYAVVPRDVTVTSP